MWRRRLKLPTWASWMSSMSRQTSLEKARSFKPYETRWTTQKWTNCAVTTGSSKCRLWMNWSVLSGWKSWWRLPILTRRKSWSCPSLKVIRCQLEILWSKSECLLITSCRAKNWLSLPSIQSRIFWWMKSSRSATIRHRHWTRNSKINFKWTRRG